MADNVIANAGSGGSTFRTLADSGNIEWPASVVCYATTLSPGANVLQVVTTSAGLPVAQQGTWTVTANAGTGTLNVAVASALPAGTNLIGGVELVDSGGVNKASISAGGAVKVDGSAVTQPVSGAVTANQGGTWTVQPGNTPNTTPWLATINQGGNSATVTASNALKVDGSAVTQPVSGTVTANAGTGTFTVQDVADGPVTPGTVATKSILIGGQYNSSAPSPSTGQQLALQLDSSGNLNVHVQAGGGSGGTSSSFGSTFPSTGTAAGFKDSGGNMAGGNLDSSGNLKVNVAAGSSGNAAASATGSAVPADADYAGLNVGGTLRGWTGVNPTGTVYAAQCDLTSVGGTSVALGQTTMSASIPVVIASNQSAVTVSGSGTFTVSGTVTANIGTTNGLALDTSVNGILVAQGSTTSGEKGPLIQGAVTTSAPSYTTAQTSPLSLNTSGGLRVDGSGVTQPVSGTVTANAGTGNFAVNVAQVSGSSVATAATGIMKVGLTDASGNALNQGASGALKVDLVSTQSNTNNILVAPQAIASGGATPYHLVSAASTNATSVKASAGTVYSVQAFNTNASARYLKFFNKASAPTLGTDTPVKVIMMPGNASGAGATATFPVGVNFSTGIAFAITGGIADSDSTAVGASDCVISFDYL